MAWSANAVLAVPHMRAVHAYVITAHSATAIVTVQAAMMRPHMMRQMKRTKQRLSLRSALQRDEAWGGKRMLRDQTAVMTT
eukprot:605203-Pelagomonas_calceolata.AAC.1